MDRVRRGPQRDPGRAARASRRTQRLSGRVPDLRPDELDGERKRVHDALLAERGAVRGPFALFVRIPELAEAANRFGAALRAGPIEKRHYELIALVVSRAGSVQYSWWAHARRPDTGLDPAVVEAIRTRRVPPFARDDDRLVYDLAVELVETRDLSQPSYERAVAAFGIETTIALVTTVGYYTLIGTVLKAFDAPVPGGGRPLP